MKKDSKKLTLMIHQNTRNELEQQARRSNQSMTKYIESLITKKEKFSPKVIQAINKSSHILNTHINSYKALNSAISNLNQLTYLLHINEYLKKDEIIDIIELVKMCVIENKEKQEAIIKILSPFTNTKTTIAKRKTNSSNDDKNNDKEKESL